MRVLQINSVCGIGSTGRIATDIHKSLIEQGHESFIAYGRGLPKNCDNLIKIGGRIDNYIHVAKTRILDKHGFGSKRATIEFINKVKEVNPDIIHLHNIHGYYINIEILFNYLKEANKPVVWTLHDCWSFTGHCSHFDYISCDKWMIGCFQCPQKKDYPKSIFLDKSKINYLKKKEIFTGIRNLTLITPSHWLGELVKKSYLNKYPIEVIHNGVNLAIFKPIESKFREQYKLEDKFIILAVANDWTTKKGFWEYLKLSKKLNSDEVLIMVGISKKQKKLLPNNIIGITRTNTSTELAEIYSDANLFLNLTLEDTFPTVNLEALACGLPIITYNSGGSGEGINPEFISIIEKENIDDAIGKIYEFKRVSRLIKNKDSKQNKDYISAEKFINSIIKLYNHKVK